MENIKVKQVIISKQPEDSENLQKFKEIIKEKKINVAVVGTGDFPAANYNGSVKTYPHIYNNKIYLEKNLYFEIIWPNNSRLILQNALNNNSIVCKLHYNDFSMLFTGDIEEIAEKEILEAYKNNLDILNSTILKVAHHGSKTSSTQEFLEAVQPKIALIGVSENNKFGHPNAEVIKRLQSMRNQDI